MIHTTSDRTPLTVAERRQPYLRFAILLCGVFGLGACANLPHRDPLNIRVAGIESLPGEGMEMRLAVTLRIQNPNDDEVGFSGAALDLDLNGRALASGVTDIEGIVPRFGETTVTIPVTISAFDMVRQVVGLVNASNDGEVNYRVSGKLGGGVLGTRRFSDSGSIALDLSAPER